MNPMDMTGLYARETVDRAHTSRTEQAARAAAAGSGQPAGQRVDIDKSSRLYKVSQEFEAILVKQMLNTMRKTVDKSGLIDGGMAEEIFEDMLYDEYALKMVRTAGFGLADQLYLQLVRDEASDGL